MGEWLAFTFALSGRRFGFYVTQGVALGLELAGLSAREGRPNIRPPHFASKVSYSAAPHLSAQFLQCHYQVVDSRPKVMLPSSASNATSGREQRYQRPRIDDLLGISRKP